VSPLGALWLASVLGAALFLAAGFLAATVRRGRLVGAASAGDLLTQFEAHHDPAEDRVAAALLERDSSRAKLAGVRAELDDARREAAALRDAAQSIQRYLAEAEAKARAGDEAQRRLSKATDESKRLNEDARALSAKVTDLTRQLDEAVRSAAGADLLRDADAQRRDLTVRIGVLEGRLRDAEHLREENAALRATVRDRGILEEKLRAAQHQLSAPEDWEPPESASTPSPRAPHVDGSWREKLRSTLASLARHEGVRAALFADDLGFPVEAAGAYAEPLAALSGILAGAAVKARQLLPLGPAARIVIVDDREVTITTRRRATDYGPLALVTLTEGPSPEVDVADVDA
jgi:hypothetical protein